jgi:hypothetical protein
LEWQLCTGFWSLRLREVAFILTEDILTEGIRMEGIRMDTHMDTHTAITIMMNYEEEAKWPIQLIDSQKFIINQF